MFFRLLQFYNDEFFIIIVSLTKRLMMTYDNYFMNSVIFDIHYAIFQNSVELTVNLGGQ